MRRYLGLAELVCPIERWVEERTYRVLFGFEVSAHMSSLEDTWRQKSIGCRRLDERKQPTSFESCCEEPFGDHSSPASSDFKISLGDYRRACAVQC